MTQVQYPDGPKNAEEAAKARVGDELYDMIFKGYTTKQWDRNPKDLAASVTQRIPVRTNSDERYFSDPHQAEPEWGFTGMIEKMITHPKIRYYLNTDFFDFRKTHDLTRYKKIFYTGPIDQYFVSQGYEKLEYRSLKFKTVTEHAKEPGGFVQPSVQLNRPHVDVPYTRSCEYTWIPWKPRPPPDSTASSLIFEYPSTDGEPYYPVPNPRNQELFAKYQKLAQQEEQDKNVYFIGRLANYKYFNMDDAALNAINFFEKLYNLKLPPIDQDLIFITVTWAGKGMAEEADIRPLKGQFYTPRFETRLWSLCRLGYKIRQDGGTYWMIVEDGEQPDSQVKDLIFSLGFQHYAYTFAGPTKKGQERVLPRQAALDYIAENKMDEHARVFEADDLKGYDSEVFHKLRSSKGQDLGVHERENWDKEDDDSHEADHFCANLLTDKLGVSLPPHLLQYHTNTATPALVSSSWQLLLGLCTGLWLVGWPR